MGGVCPVTLRSAVVGDNTNTSVGWSIAPSSNRSVETGRILVRVPEVRNMDRRYQGVGGSEVGAASSAVVGDNTTRIVWELRLSEAVGCVTLFGRGW